MPYKAQAWAAETLRKHWFYLLLQVIALAFAIRWIPDSRLPSPGYAVAWLAVLAAVMSVHQEMRPWQKSIWLLLIGVFLLTELRAIRKDHIDTDHKATADRQKQDEAFKKVLDAENADFKATDKVIRTAIGGIDSTLETTKRTLTSLETGSWNFEFDMNCGSKLIKSDCADVWNLDKNDHQHTLFERRLDVWPKHLDDRILGDPLSWQVSFFRDPKKADAYLDEFFGRKGSDRDQHDPDLRFDVEAIQAIDPKLISNPNRHRITLKIKDYRPALHQSETSEVTSLYDLPGSTVLIFGLSPRTPAPIHMWVHLNNGMPFTLLDKGKLKPIHSPSSDIAFRLTIPRPKQPQPHHASTSSAR